MKQGCLGLTRYIGLVTSPGTIHISSVAAPALFEFRNVALHPSQNRCMSQDHTPFGHHPDQVSGTQLETQIPPDTKHNNFLIEMSSFEENEAWRRGHLTIISSSPICFHCLHQNQTDRPQRRSLHVDLFPQPDKIGPHESRKARMVPQWRKNPVKTLAVKTTSILCGLLLAATGCARVTGSDKTGLVVDTAEGPVTGLVRNGV